MNKIKKEIKKAKENKKSFAHFIIIMILSIMIMIIGSAENSWTTIVLLYGHLLISLLYYAKYKKEIKKAAELFLLEEDIQ